MKLKINREKDDHGGFTLLKMVVPYWVLNAAIVTGLTSWKQDSKPLY